MRGTAAPHVGQLTCVPSICSPQVEQRMSRLSCTGPDCTAHITPYEMTSRRIHGLARPASVDPNDHQLELRTRLLRSSARPRKVDRHSATARDAQKEESR